MQTGKPQQKSRLCVLRFLRQEKGLSQRRLAEKTGISRGRLYRLEAGGFDTATYEELHRIAAVLEIGVEEIFRSNGLSHGSASNGHGSRDLLQWREKQGKFRIALLLPPRPDLFVGKLILAAGESLSSVEIPATRTVFLQALMGPLRLVLDRKDQELGEGEHLSFSGYASYTILNPSVREQISLLIISPSPWGVPFQKVQS